MHCYGTATIYPKTAEYGYSGPEDELLEILETDTAVDEALKEVYFYVSKTIGGSEGEEGEEEEDEEEDGLLVGVAEGPDEFIAAKEGMNFAIVWETTHENVNMEVTLDFGDGQVEFLTQNLLAESV